MAPIEHPKICIHAFVAGQVQGVYFRAHTKQEAKKLQLTGWVKNCPDGRVEVLACGSKSAVEALQAWLWRGSPRSVVKNVAVEEAEWQEFSDFKILR